MLSPEQYEILRHHDTERPYGKSTTNSKSRLKAPTIASAATPNCLPPRRNSMPVVDGPPFMTPPSIRTLKPSATPPPECFAFEVRCKVCEGHLGHIFEGEGFNTPTDQRYCINGKVLKFVPKAAADDQRKGEKDPAKDNKPSKKSE